MPDVAFVPDQPPEAVQEDVFVEDHVNVALAPDASDVGDALSVTVGAVTTVTVADAFVVPPAPLQLSV